MNERIRAYRDTLLLTLIALPLGLAIGAMDALFGRVLLSVTAFRMAHVYSLLPFLGLVGVGIVWCYQKVGGTSGKGMTLEAGHGDTQGIPLRLIPLVMVSTWLTHLFGGSAGREGVAVRGGTLAHSIGKRLPIPDAGKQLLLTGMAAGFAGLFRTPIAATFFALEVLTAGVLEYSALLPALVASFSASACSGLLGLEKFTVALTDQVAFSAPLGASCSCSAWSLAWRHVRLCPAQAQGTFRPMLPIRCCASSCSVSLSAAPFSAGGTLLRSGHQSDCHEL